MLENALKHWVKKIYDQKNDVDNVERTLQFDFAKRGPNTNNNLVEASLFRKLDTKKERENPATHIRQMYYPRHYLEEPEQVNFFTSLEKQRIYIFDDRFDRKTMFKYSNSLVLVRQNYFWSWRNNQREHETSVSFESRCANSLEI